VVEWWILGLMTLFVELDVNLLICRDDIIVGEDVNANAMSI